MLIGVKKRFMFIANSKTASTSVENALMSHAEIHRGGTPQHKHIFIKDALREYSFLFDQPEYNPETFFKFGIMRDPIDWIHSWFRFRKGNKVANPLPKEMTFAEFWHRKDWNIQFHDGRKRLQKNFFLAENGDVLADYIIPFAEIGQHFDHILKTLGVKSTLSQLNTSKISSLDNEISEDLKAEMRDFYAEDYALLHRLSDINKSGSKHLLATRPQNVEPTRNLSGTATTAN